MMNYVNLRKWKFGLAAVLVTGLPAGAAAMQWPDTAQRNCYDNTGTIVCPDDETAPFYGQDAQYNGPTRSYTKLGQDGVELDDTATDWIMVRDNVTGLIWEVKNNNDGTEDYTNSRDADNKYFWCDSSSIFPGRCGEEYNDTEDFITSLNEFNFGGYSDWRLPTVSELSSLLLYTGDAYMINSEYFNATKTAWYNTGTQRAGGGTSLNATWLVAFDKYESSSLSFIGEGSSYPYHSRAVRDNN